MPSVEFQANTRARPADDAAKAAAICASGRVFAVNGEARRLRRIARALASHADVEVLVHRGLLLAWPAGRGEEMLPIGVLVRKPDRPGSSA
jgi:hypothetical protein